MKYKFSLGNNICIEIDSKTSDTITVFDENNKLIKAKKVTALNDKDEKYLIIIPEKYLVKKK